MENYHRNFTQLLEISVQYPLRVLFGAKYADFVLQLSACEIKWQTWKSYPINI